MSTSLIQSSSYVGRFAPSPTGDLHFGSLIAAVGSYLQAKKQHGKWLLRIDDIDPPREVKGAADAIQRSLEAHGLYWDDTAVLQSSRLQHYKQLLTDLKQAEQVYACTCTRKRVQALGGYYDGHCQTLANSEQDASLRIHNRCAVTSFHDNQLGEVNVSALTAQEDFIVKRKDGLIAYHFACAVDEHDMGITEVVRGSDLLQPTACQLMLFKLFGWQAPQYRHLPVAVTRPGKKLSKQNHATALNADNATGNLVRALQFLHQPVEPEWNTVSPSEVLELATARWRPEAIGTQREIIVGAAE